MGRVKSYMSKQVPMRWKGSRELAFFTAPTCVQLVVQENSAICRVVVPAAFSHCCPVCPWEQGRAPCRAQGLSSMRMREVSP